MLLPVTCNLILYARAQICKHTQTNLVHEPTPGYRIIQKHNINPETQTKSDPGSTNNFIGPQATQLAIIFNPRENKKNCWQWQWCMLTAIFVRSCCLLVSFCSRSAVVRSSVHSFVLIVLFVTMFVCVRTLPFVLVTILLLLLYFVVCLCTLLLHMCFSKV